MRASRDFGKTHDLGRLADEVTKVFPEVGTLVATMRDWTDWSIEYRYPSMGEREPEPTPDVLNGALAVIDPVKAVLLSRAPPA